MQAVAEAEGLTLVVADNSTGYLGVRLRESKSTPFRASVRRGGKNVHLGYFATAVEAAMCVARTPERREAEAAERAAAPQLTSKGALQQAQAEGLTLIKTTNTTGYLGVFDHGNKTGNRRKPYEARVRYGGKNASLGRFATAEEASLCVARSPGGQAAAKRAAAAPPLTSEEALQQAQAEGLALRVAKKNKTGHFGVHHLSGRPKPYMVQVPRGGKQVSLGSFVTAEEAALCYARSLGVQAAAERASAAGPPLPSKEALQQAQAEGLTLVKTDSTTGYFGVSLNKGRKNKRFRAHVRRDGENVHLGCFATAEEAALCIARSPAPPLVSEKYAGRLLKKRWALTNGDGGGDDAGEEEDEEEFEVLDAVEVLDAWTDDDDDKVSSS